MKKGEITVFLSLTVVLLVSFILGMMNAANIQLMKNQARIDVTVRCILCLENIRQICWKSIIFSV